MRHAFRLAASCLTSTTVFALAACGGMAPAAPPAAGVAPAAPVGSMPAAARAKPRLLYVANDTDVIVYPADQSNPQPIRTITEGIDQPEGLAVDGKGTLYVANSMGNNVTEYRAGQSAPFRTISSGVRDPQGITVDANGTLYVGNRIIGQQEVYVTEYPRGSLTPSLTITFPTHNLPRIGGLGVDSELNLYVLTVLDKVSVTKFPPGSTNGTDLGLQGLGSFGDGLGLDGAGNLYVAVSGGPINVYPPGAIKPNRTISRGLTSPAFFVVTPRGALYVPNQASGSDGTVLEFPANRNSPKFTINGFDYPKGTAVF